MRFLETTFGEDMNRARRVARLLSLIPLAFTLSITLFNEDVLTGPVFPFLVLGLVTLFMVGAWRWEREGGLLTMAGAPVLWISLVANAVFQVDFPLWLAAVVASTLSLPYLIIGWLFYSVGRAAGLSHHNRSVEQQPSSRPWSLVIVLGIVALALLITLPLFLGLTATAPGGQRQVIETGPCMEPVSSARPLLAMNPPFEPLPNSLKGYELHSYQWEGEWYFSFEVGLNRVRTADENYYVEGTAFTVKGVDDLKAMLLQLPAGEEVIWCAANRPDQTVVDEVQRHANRYDITLSVP